MLNQDHTVTKVSGKYSQHLIFFVTYELAQQARVLYETRLERLASGEQSNLLGPFIS